MLTNLFHSKAFFKIHASKVCGSNTHIIIQITTTHKVCIRSKAIALYRKEVIVIITLTIYQRVNERLTHVIIYGR